jgi:protein-L-isoaspartate O-methyltransferase/flavodoxin/Pyruvate/2-oxoacid:ferredoxin oxidoreductase delta subunit
MKIAIIQFSPSGNTSKVAEMLKNELKQRNQEVQLIDITHEKQFFVEKDAQNFLLEKVKQHDVLLIGSPVYAHHLQYHVKDLIKVLPKPNEIWGKYAIPFVTYGGLTSGIALKEAAELLKKSGRIIHAGMKVSASHRMTRAFMSEEFNKNKLLDNNMSQIIELVNRIMQLNHNKVAKCNAKSLDYNGLVSTLKANIIFKEKLWHEKRYPKICIDHKICTNCGKCAINCPVMHLIKKDTTININDESPCIHCLNCVTDCPNKAIKLVGDLEKGRAFMSKMISKKGNKEMPETAVYPFLVNEKVSGKSKIGNFIYLKMFAGLESKIRYKKYNPETALKSAGIETATNILEVGCGSGYYTLPAASMIQNDCNYLAIDIHPHAVEETSKRLESHGFKNINIEQGNALNTMLPDKSFDTILLFGVIPSTFLPLEKLIPEMSRILQDGGCLSVWTLNNMNLIKNITKSGQFEYLCKVEGVYKFIKTTNKQ